MSSRYEPAPMAPSASPERFDPETHPGTLMHSEHAARYWWASQLAGGLAVLDAGCGAGYGTALLAMSQPARLIAVDISDEAVELTRAAVDGGAEVLVSDVRELPLDDDVVDLVVCFEVIEHMDRRAETLREFARVLRPDGLLLISSPNRNEYPAGNEHHVYEYTPDEFEREIGAVFPNVRLYRQHAWLASIVVQASKLAVSSRGSGVGAVLHALTDEAVEHEEMYTVAMASRGPLPETESYVVMGDPFELRWWSDQLELREADLDRGRDAQAELERRILVAERELESREQRLREVGQRLLAAEQDHAELVAAHAEAQAQLEMTREDLGGELERVSALYERANRVVADMQDSVSWRLTAPLRGLKRMLRRARLRP
jgi:SAM-dependent methyltransferase